MFKDEIKSSNLKIAFSTYYQIQETKKKSKADMHI